MTSTLLCLTVRFLDPEPMFHGRGDGGEPEWPPSPLRIFQALVAAAAARWREPQFSEYAASALKWIATRAPVIVAPGIHRRRTPYRMYVPNNAGDLMTAAWDRGDADASMAKQRTEKDVWPTRLMHDEHAPGAISYLYTLPQTEPDCEQIPKVVSEAARSVTHLGWGIDMVTANASVIDSNVASTLSGERWYPVAGGSSRVRIPRDGTLDALIHRHQAFLNRIGPGTFNPVPPLSEFSIVGYQSASAPAARPFVVFELLKDDDTRFSYPQDKLIHLAGMVRHLAIESMNNSPPEGVADDWVETYVTGHAKPGALDHRQFSYLPLPSIGYAHTDPAVRRVMITAPLGDDRLLNHLAQCLSGRRLKPTQQTKLSHPPTLVQIRGDFVTNCYIEEANVWASVTPVILPGHDDHKEGKTAELICKALKQSGVEAPCTFEWSALSHFPKSLPAHKYKKDPNNPDKKIQINYLRPDHLIDKTGVHLRITFDNGAKIPGPLAIGAGRHCGLGIFARVES